MSGNSRLHYEGSSAQIFMLNNLGFLRSCQEGETSELPVSKPEMNLHEFFLELLWSQAPFPHEASYKSWNHWLWDQVYSTAFWKWENPKILMLVFGCTFINVHKYLGFNKLVSLKINTLSKSSCSSLNMTNLQTTHRWPLVNNLIFYKLLNLCACIYMDKYIDIFAFTWIEHLDITWRLNID